MHQNGHFKYYKDDGYKFSAVELPYKVGTSLLCFKCSKNILFFFPTIDSEIIFTVDDNRQFKYIDYRALGRRFRDADHTAGPSGRVEGFGKRVPQEL